MTLGAPSSVRPLSQLQHRFDGAVVYIGLQVEAQLFADGLHLAVFREDRRNYGFEVLVARHFNQALIEQRAQALMLETVVDEHGHLAVVLAAGGSSGQWR